MTTGWWILAGTAAVIAVAVWAVRMRSRLVAVTVDGGSMEPAFRDGDVVLVRRVGPGGEVRRGQVVAFLPVYDESLTPPKDGRLWLLKRVAAAPGDPIPPGLGPALAHLAGEKVPAGRLVLLGDNPGRSHDSRQEGLVDAGRLRGVVLRRIREGPAPS